MNERRTVRLAAILCLGAVLGLAGSVRAEGEVEVPTQLGPGSVLWLEGTSTMHDFESKSSAVQVALTRDPAAAAPMDAVTLAALMAGAQVRGVTVRVPVATLKSGKDGLDKNLRKTMLAEQHPEVRFHLARYAVTATHGDTLVLKAEGSLTVAGQERPVELVGRAWPSGAGVWLEGRKALKMSDYGMKPPRMMMGALKVGDAIDVEYKLHLIPKAGLSGSASPGRN